MQNINESNFNQLTSQGVVLVDFSANWCPPCKALTPILETIKNAKVFKVDIDESQQLAVDHRVSAIPVMMFMKDGVEKHRIVGLASAKVIQDKVNELNGV